MKNHMWNSRASIKSYLRPNHAPDKKLKTTDPYFSWKNWCLFSSTFLSKAWFVSSHNSLLRNYFMQTFSIVGPLKIKIYAKKFNLKGPKSSKIYMWNIRAMTDCNLRSNNALDQKVEEKRHQFFHKK